MTRKPDYFYKCIENLVIIYDLNKGNMTVTNGIEQVLREIAENEPISGKIIIYRDSEGDYNRALYNKELDCVGFEFPINSAMQAYVGLTLLESIYTSCAPE